MNIKFNELEKRIESLEFALTQAKSPEEAMSIIYELNRLKKQLHDDRVRLNYQ